MKLKLLPLCLILAACATGHRRTSAELRDLVMANNYDKAIKFLTESPLAKDKSSNLLYFLELGLLEHYRGDYTKSIEALNSAKGIVDELYTASASKKVATIFTNDNSDLYYGEKFETSLIHFYLALNHYMLGDLEKARAEVMAWDTFLTHMKHERLGKALFKEDLLAKTFGALVHESIGTHNDLQIALQLYKDAKNVFFKNYNLFPTFNAEFKLFRENFANLPKLPLKEVEGKYVKATEHSNSFNEFLTMKIETITKRLKHKSTAPNITFLIQDGLIAEKYPQKYAFPLYLGAQSAMAFSLGVGNTVQYELPAVEPAPVLEVAILEALDKEGKVVAQAPLSVIAPLGELAEQAVNEHSTAIAAKTGARVAGKHIAALVAAQVAARSGGSDAAAVAGLVAMVSHTAAVVAINQSEKADVRYWSTLPSNIRMGQMSLNEGTYKFRAVYGLGLRTVELGEQTVTKSNIKFVMDNKNLKYKSTRLASSNPIRVEPEKGYVSPLAEKTPKVAKAKSIDCSKDSECPDGMVCATIRGEYPGSCAATGIFGGMGIRRGPNSQEEKGCMKDSECGEGKVCATVKGEYPGACAEKG